MQADVASGEPPLDGSAERGSPAPAIRVAAALAPAGIVDALEQGSCHRRIVPDAEPSFLSAQMAAQEGGCLGDPGVALTARPLVRAARIVVDLEYQT